MAKAKKKQQNTEPELFDEVIKVEKVSGFSQFEIVDTLKI